MFANGGRRINLFSVTGGVFSLLTVVLFATSHPFWGAGCFVAALLAWAMSPKAKVAISSVFGLSAVAYLLLLSNRLVGIIYLVLAVIALLRNNK